MPVNVIPILAQTKKFSQANAKALDHISSTRLSRSKPSAPPISKQILTEILSSKRNHVIVEHEQENHFLHGLVLPLVARILAVSTPGLLVIVQLPRPDVTPAWAVPAYDGYGSNGSACKSAATTAPSPQGTTRTPSPSDVIPNARKSISPDVHPGTEELIRRAGKVLSTQAQNLVEREDGSPPPDSVVQDNAALRLICNGFEVLTGKMPPPSFDMGPCTLASVAWEKAGVLEPEDHGKGVSMSFSNGMMTPTEGIVVTFSNGSLCLLTTRDPLSSLDSLKISDQTPVVVFSFISDGYASAAELLAMKPDTLTPDAAKVRESFQKPNFFFVEIGQSGATPSITFGDDPEVQGSPSKSEKSIGQKGLNDVKRKKAGNCPPILISSVPRAIPLFVNTINQTFIDPPHYDHTENYEPDVVNHCFPERSEPADEQQETRLGSSLDDGKASLQATQSNETADRDEETDRKTVVASPPALETRKPSTVTGSQPSKTLPPVEEVVRMSQGIPGGHGHHPPVYNYPYPPGPMYASNPQNHHAVPHHLAPVHGGQSMGNPYYMPTHTNGHTGHHAQYQPRYPHGGYYAQHVVPGHENWHRVPQYHSLPPHPLDARLDMPVQFAHRANGQYGTSYYPATQQGEMYQSQVNVASGAMPQQINNAGQHPPQACVPGVPTTVAPMAEPMKPPLESSPLSTDIARSVPHTPQGKPSLNVTDGSQEHALEALMRMGSKEHDVGPENSREAQMRGTGNNVVMGNEQRAPMRRDSGRSPVKRCRQTETSSSTSANSGGGALVNGAVVGHSHVPLHQKRRKR